jgi:hypothetical protein
MRCFYPFLNLSGPNYIGIFGIIFSLTTMVVCHKHCKISLDLVLANNDNSMGCKFLLFGNEPATPPHSFLTTMITNILPLSLIFLINAQPPPCDPFYEVCPGVACDPVGLAGQVIITSPNDTSFAYLEQPVLISIKTTDLTNEKYSFN